MSSHSFNQNHIEISVITDPADLPACQDISSACFHDDAIFNAFNPGWQTPDGRERAIKRLGGWLSSTTHDAQGRPNTIFLKVTVPTPTTTTTDATTAADNGGRRIVGFALWIQCSCSPGHGDPPPTDFGKTLNVITLYPDNPKMQRCTAQMVASMTRQRYDVVRAIAGSTPSALLACDLCLVHPDYQGKGVGKRLIQWGLDEAERRGGLECVLEASVMGRGMYKKLGFVEIGSDITYDEVEDLNFVQGMVLPSTVFMRTRPDGRVLTVSDL